MPWFLRMGDDPLEDATQHDTKADAVSEYAATAHELARYGQAIEASLHKGPDPVEDPDFVLSLGPRGGIRCEPI